MKLAFYIFIQIFSWFELYCTQLRVKTDLKETASGCHATLLCLYTLPVSSVYSVKWYRGTYEFYRYLPKETPPDKSFDKPGISVQMELSNATQVTLKNVSLAVAGRFTCEVSADEPTFITVNDTAFLHVYELSKVQRPEIRTSEPRYRIGTQFFVICSLPISTRAVGSPNTPYSMNFYQDGEKVNPLAVSSQPYKMFVVAANLLNWKNSTRKCFYCEVSVCDVYKRTSKTICVDLTSGCLGNTNLNVHAVNTFLYSLQSIIFTAVFFASF